MLLKHKATFYNLAMEFASGRNTDKWKYADRISTPHLTAGLDGEIMLQMNAPGKINSRVEFRNKDRQTKNHAIQDAGVSFYKAGSLFRPLCPSDLNSFVSFCFASKQAFSIFTRVEQHPRLQISSRKNTTKIYRPSQLGGPWI